MKPDELEKIINEAFENKQKIFLKIQIKKS